MLMKCCFSLNDVCTTLTDKRCSITSNLRPLTLEVNYTACYVVVQFERKVTNLCSTTTTANNYNYYKYVCYFVYVLQIKTSILYWVTLIMSINQSINAEFVGRRYTTRPEEATFIKSCSCSWQNVGLWASGPQSVSAAGCRNRGNTAWKVFWC